MTRKNAGIPYRGKEGATPRPQGSAAPAKCTRCGTNRHQGSEKCPARNVICHKCKKKGHFKAHCLSRGSTASTSEVEVQDDTAFLGTLSSEESSIWRYTVKLNDKEVEFKMDTGLR